LRISLTVFCRCLLVLISILVYAPTLAAQSHITVPLDDRIYYIIEQAQLRGFCQPLSGARPYTKNVLSSAIREILSSDNNEKLTNTERQILEQYLSDYSKPDTGIDWFKGRYHGEVTLGSNFLITADIGLHADTQWSVGFYSEDIYYGTDTWIQAYLNGDIGNNFSYTFIAEGGLIRAPSLQLGEYNTYYEGFKGKAGQLGKPEKEYQNNLIKAYSSPLTHFPYTYQKRWDGSIFFFDSLSTHRHWPDDFAGSYNFKGELTSSFLDNKLLFRAGRISHDWGAAPHGSSLFLNQMARPFFAAEAEFSPVSWFTIASLTGILEYYNTENIKTSSATFQNAYSITMLQFRFRNYLFVDFADAVVWPKRFDLGYISPLINSFFYQNNIGDFDNMVLSFNLKAQYPGLGYIWASLLLDEINFLHGIKGLQELDSQMFAYQAGVTVFLPFLSFTSIKLSYTKINPYTYTHNRNFNPWYGNLRMETAYINNGVSLGHYLPPNSDELLFRFETMPAGNVTAHFQYQMIRHGADFGPGAVDGSNLLSELDPSNRDGSNPVLKRYFLKDGAYQWQHIIKIGAEWTLKKAPISFYGEFGTVISYFTNIAGSANSGKAGNYTIIDTLDYPQSTSFILKLGIKIFP